MASLSVIIGGDDRALQAALRRAQSGMRKLGKELRTGVNDFAKWGAAAAAAAAAGAAFLVKQQLEAADALAKTADKLGLTTEALDGLRRAAELSGVGANTLDMALQRMTRRLSEAAAGTGEAKGALKELGLDAQALAAMAPDRAFAEIARAMGEVDTQGAKVRLAFKLFDSEGVALVNTLALGREGLAAAAEETRVFGTAISAVDAKQIELANDSMSRIGLAMDGFWRQVTIQVAPALKLIGDELFNAAKEAGGMGNIATNAMAKVVAAGGFVADSVDGVRRVFIIAADGIIVAMSGAESAVRRLFAAQLQLAKISTLGFSDTVKEWAEENAAAMRVSDRVVGLALDNIQATLMEPMPSENIEAFWDRVGKASRKGAEEIVRARSTITAGGGEGDGGVSDKERDALQKKLDKMREQFMSEDELLFERREKELEDIRAFEEQKLIIAEEAALLREEAEQAHWDRIGAAHEKASQAAIALEKAKNAALKAAQADFMNNMAGLMNTQSRKVFELGKAAATAQALIKGKQAVVDAWQAGMSTGGPWAPAVAAAYAAAAGLNAANLVNNIRSQQFGGGGGAPTAPTQGASNISPNGAGGGSIPAGGGGGGGQATIVNLQGDFFSRDQVRRFFELLNEEAGDGGRFILA